MQFLTRQFFDTLIIIVIVVGLALAAVRLYADLSRRLPPEQPVNPNEKPYTDSDEQR